MLCCACGGLEGIHPISCITGPQVALTTSQGKQKKVRALAVLFRSLSFKQMQVPKSWYNAPNAISLTNRL